MNCFVVFLLITSFAAINAIAAKSPVICQRSFSKIGCFKEIESRPDLSLSPMTLEINDRDISSTKYQGYLIDWANLEASVHSLACRCASVVRSMKMNYFSLRFWGECWVGKTDIEKLVLTLQDPKWLSTDCVNSWSYIGVCDHKHEKECVAKAGSGYIYFLDDTRKSKESIDGGYSEWSVFTECTNSCGLGIIKRERTCTNPVPKGIGKDCSNLGPMNEEKLCNLRQCPVNGGYGQWSNYSSCSKECGHATQTRTRLCDSPLPEHGGKDCDLLGPSSEQIDCYTQCPVQSAIACEAEDLHINCYGKGTIQVSAANYGRRSNDVCYDLRRFHKTRQNANCGDEWYSFKIVESRCQNKEYCIVRAGNEVFRNPCPLFVYKYLQVYYYCSG